MILSDILIGNARRVPGDPAYTFEAQTWTWAETNARVNRFANALRSAGIAFGDRVVLLADNSHRYLEALYAFAKLGVISVPMSPRSAVRDLDFTLTETQARALIISAPNVARFGGIGAPPPSLTTAVGWGEGHGLPYDFETMIAGAPDTEVEAPVGDETIRAVKFTSGTTGEPKGCIAIHRAIMDHMRSYLIEGPHIPEHSVGLTALSLGTGLALNTVAAFAYRNARTVIMERFDADAMLDTIAREGVRRIIAVPTMIGALTQAQAARPRDLAALAEIFYSGAPASVPLMRRATDVLGCGFLSGYGSTESGGNVTFISPEEHERLVRSAGDVRDAWGRSVLSCGREVQSAHLRIVDDALHDVAPGEVGELYIGWPSVFQGYWNRPQETAKSLHEGWLLTGDLARKDPDGLYYIVDRKRDMIVTGGFNVYAIEVESVLGEHAAVAEAAVVGIYDPHWGEAVHAFVMLARGGAASPDDLIAHCREVLGSQKAPKTVHIVDDFPRTSTGKVRKGVLREQYTPRDAGGAPLMA